MKKNFLLIKIDPKEARNTTQLYTPFYESDIETSRGLSLGQKVAGSVAEKKLRNIAFHKKYWALIRFTYHQMPEMLEDRIKSEYELHQEIKMQVGLREKRVSLSGREYYIPGSIAFDKMDEDSFSEFYQKAVDVVCKWVLPGNTPEEVERELMEFM